MEHPRLIETAFVNLLGDVSGWSAGLLILAGEEHLDKNATRIVAVADMGEEEPPGGGNRWADVMIELRTPYAILTAREKASGVPEPLDLHQANAGLLQTAILSTTLPDQLTAAVDNFTCFGLSDRQPIREQTPSYWSSGWKVRLFSCPSDVS